MKSVDYLSYSYSHVDHEPPSQHNLYDFQKDFRQDQTESLTKEKTKQIIDKLKQQVYEDDIVPLA